MSQRTNSTTVISNALIGAAAGALAVWVMDQVDWFNFQNEDHKARQRTKSVRPAGMDPAHVIAYRVAQGFDTRLEPRDHNAAGIAVHYAIGMGPAAVYGSLRQKVPALTHGHGALFGVALFLAQDELLNAVAGLSAKPQEYPWQAHARGLLSHVIYGLVLETTLTLAADGPPNDKGGHRTPVNVPALD